MKNIANKRVVHIIELENLYRCHGILEHEFGLYISQKIVWV